MQQSGQIQQFYEDAKSAYLRAGRSGELIQKYISIGGKTVCLSFPNYSLLPYLYPAVSHLEIEPDTNPSFTIHLWDSASTNTTMLTIPWPDHEFIKLRSENILGTFNPISGMLMMSDLDRNEGLCWVRDVDKIPFNEVAAPIRHLFYWFGQKFGIQLVHSGGVGFSSGGILLAGKGGSGKSTTALACLASDLLYAGDDYCMLANGSRPMIFSLYNTAKKNADDIRRIPDLKHSIGNLKKLSNEKAVYHIYHHFPEKILLSYPLKAIVIPRITEKNGTTAKKLSPSKALISLAPSTIFQLYGTGENDLQLMARIVKQTPAFVLEVGTDLSTIPVEIEKILKDLP